MFLLKIEVFLFQMNCGFLLSQEYLTCEIYKLDHNSWLQSVSFKPSCTIVTVFAQTHKDQGSTNENNLWNLDFWRKKGDLSTTQVEGLFWENFREKLTLSGRMFFQTHYFTVTQKYLEICPIMQ